MTSRSIISATATTRPPTLHDDGSERREAGFGSEHDGRRVFSFGVNNCVTEERGRPRVSEAASIINARELLGTAKAWLPTLMIGPPPTSEMN